MTLDEFSAILLTGGAAIICSSLAIVLAALGSKLLRAAYAPKRLRNGTHATPNSGATGNADTHRLRKSWRS